MKRRLVLITEIISPYRIPLFNALAKRPELGLHVLFLGQNDPSLRDWRVYWEEIKFSFEVLPSWRRRIGKYNALLNTGVFSALKKNRPELILCGGYNYVASWEALWWARKRKVPFLLWSESNREDQRRQLPAVEFLKRQFLRRCSGFVVPGRAAFDYLKGQQVSDRPIFVAPNAVDNKAFADASKVARDRETVLREELGLPQRYYLFVGRLVHEKGVFELLAAYSKLDPQLRQQIGLVVAGDGSAREEMQQLALGVSPGRIVFPGFVHQEDLGVYYGLAEALVLPTYTDTWGMVVNEAMACGLPVIVSRLAGCTTELIRDGWNGFLIAPKDVDRLGSAMKQIGEESGLRRRMGENSAQLISDYSPEVWANSIVEVSQSALKNF